MRAFDQVYSDYYGQVVKALDLRFNGQQSSWLRTPVLANVLFKNQNLGENVETSANYLLQNLKAISFNSKNFMQTQMKQGRPTFGKWTKTFFQK